MKHIAKFLGHGVTARASAPQEEGVTHGYMLVLIQESDLLNDDNLFTPPMDVHLYSKESIVALRDMLNEILGEEPKKQSSGVQ